MMKRALRNVRPKAKVRARRLQLLLLPNGLANSEWSTAHEQTRL